MLPPEIRERKENSSKYRENSPQNRERGWNCPRGE